MNRVVLDTNVVISALLTPTGTEAAVLLWALDGAVALYVSVPILQEYEDVLRRPCLKLPASKIEGALAVLRKASRLVHRR